MQRWAFTFGRGWLDQAPKELATALTIMNRQAEQCASVAVIGWDHLSEVVAAHSIAIPKATLEPRTGDIEALMKVFGDALADERLDLLSLVFVNFTHPGEPNKPRERVGVQGVDFATGWNHFLATFAFSFSTDPSLCMGEWAWLSAQRQIAESHLSPTVFG